MFKRQPWTEDEAWRAAKMYLSGRSKAEIGRSLGRSKESVAWKLNALNIRLSADDARRRQYKGSEKGRSARYDRGKRFDKAWDALMTRCDEILVSMSRAEKNCMRLVNDVDRYDIAAFNERLGRFPNVADGLVGRRLIKRAHSSYLPTRLGLTVASTL